MHPRRSRCPIGALPSELARRALVARLAALGLDLPVSLTVYPGATHSFIEAMSISPLADRAIEDGARWLRATIGAPAKS